MGFEGKHPRQAGVEHMVFAFVLNRHSHMGEPAQVAARNHLATHIRTAVSLRR